MWRRLTFFTAYKVIKKFEFLSVLRNVKVSETVNLPLTEQKATLVYPGKVAPGQVEVGELTEHQAREILAAPPEKREGLIEKRREKRGEENAEENFYVHYSSHYLERKPLQPHCPKDLHASLNA